MGTYFADTEQISRLRMRTRVAAESLISAQDISTEAADLVLPQSDEKVVGGKGGGAPDTVRN